MFENDLLLCPSTKAKTGFFMLGGGLAVTIFLLRLLVSQNGNGSLQQIHCGGMSFRQRVPRNVNDNA